MKKWIPCNVVRPLEIRALYTAFDITFDDAFSFAGESHNFYESICVLDGLVGIAADSDLYTVPAGNLVLHKPMEFHRIWSEGQTKPRIIIISFDATITPEPVGCVFTLSKDEQTAFESIYREIAQSCEISARRVIGIHPDSHARLQTAVNSLENLLLRVLAGSLIREAPQTESSECAIKYRDIMKYLNENLNARLSIDDVARACGMSGSGAKQIFRRYTGQGIMSYFRDLKTKEAIKMLSEGMSVKETALSLGFSDQNYFSTFFKKMTGKSPRAYMNRE